jgi:hypothetical protein
MLGAASVKGDLTPTAQRVGPACVRRHAGR